MLSTDIVIKQIDRLYSDAATENLLLLIDRRCSEGVHCQCLNADRPSVL